MPSRPRKLPAWLLAALSAPALPYGGQAAIEGVMMKGKAHVALAVRRRSGRIEILDRPVSSRFPRLTSLPFLRGAFILIDMFGVGLWALRESSHRYELDYAEPGKAGAQPAASPEAPDVAAAPGEAASDSAPPPTAAQNAMMVLSLVLSLLLFKAAPAMATSWFFNLAGLPLLRETADPTYLQQLLANSVEGLIKFGIFVGYIWGVGRIPEIGRVFEYHGAEHIVINAYEDDQSNQDIAFIQKHPVAHPRCGTSFIAIMILLSILLFSLIDYLIVHTWPSLAVHNLPVFWLRWPLRILGLIPLAGISYEIIRAAFRYFSNPLIRPLLKFGMLFQALTVRRPSDEQVEVSLASFNRARFLTEGIPEPPR